MRRKYVEWVFSLDDDKLLSTWQVASVLQVVPSTVWRWCMQGKIKYVRTPGGVYRIPAAEVKRILREWGYDIPEPELKRLLREWRSGTNVSGSEDRGDK